MHWKKVTLVGVGLLGGSLGMALRQRRLADTVAGYVRRAVSEKECLDMGAVDEVTRDLARAVAGADLVVLCTPIAWMKELAQSMAPALKPGVLVTDVGSVKGAVIQAVDPIIRAAGGHFVGSHPMAGSEKTGVMASRADLFENAMCVVTPPLGAGREEITQLEELWRGAGGRTTVLTPALHDELVAQASHLPHVAAAVLAEVVLDPERPGAQPQLCATGFSDTTRIASGSPEMWRDICLANKEALDQALSVYIERLKQFQTTLQAEDGEALEQILNRAKQRRDGWKLNGGSTTE
jgi:prephenate dehydrogenase